MCQICLLRKSYSEKYVSLGIKYFLHWFYQHSVVAELCLWKVSHSFMALALNGCLFGIVYEKNVEVATYGNNMALTSIVF